MDVAAWLSALGLGEYARAFADNDIDAEILPTLGAEDLRELGVASLGHRKRLLAAITELSRGDGAGARQQQRAAGRVPPAAALPAEGERRQVTVLFADLAGYTRLGRELDAEELHALLGRFFDLADRAIEDHGGTIDKHIGDCVMATFGAPLAHGNDPERAVRAALAIRDAMPAVAREVGRPVGVHIGIASGQVVASDTGSASHREYTVTGDSVNLASRLTDRAQTGEVLISDAVLRALADRLECAEAGDLAVKGFAEPVRAWHLLGLRGVAEPGGRRPFIGRRGELQQFKAALGACRDGGAGRTILVRGEAGIGKTRLVEEFQREAAGLGFAHHAGLVLDFGTGAGRDAVRSVVRSLLGVAPGAEPAAVRAAAGRVLADGLLEADRAVFLHDLLDLPQPRELRGVYDAMDNPTRNRGKRETVALLVAHLSRQRPLLLVVEDLHWADGLTLEHLAKLTETVTDCPALLVMTTRIEGDPIDRTWRSGAGGAPLMTIDLGPLRREEALALATAFMDGSDQLAERCIERAAGNPLFLEQLLRHAGESAEAGGVPGSVRSLVQARIDRLEPGDKQAVQAASVFGQRFALAGLRHLIGSPDYACDGLVRHFLARPQGEEFLFAHALVRDAVYDSLLRSRRRELLRRAAAWFEGQDPVLHAGHLDRAEDPAAPRAYLGAARAQADRFHYERARGLVERGLELGPDGATSYELMCLRGDLLRELGATRESHDAFNEALAHAADDRQRCRAWIGVAAAARITDSYEEALGVLDRAEAAATGHRLTKELARIHYYRGSICFPLGDIDGCLKQHELALRYAREASSPEDEARALGGLADATYSQGRMITAQAHFDRCIGLAREHGFSQIEAANLTLRGTVRYYQNDVEGGIRDRLAAAAAAVRIGDQRAEMVARGGAAYILWDRGELADARRQTERSLALARSLGARRFEALQFGCLARVAATEGRRAEAVTLAREAVAVSRATGVRFLGPWCLGGLASVAEDPAERRRALVEGEEILRSGCVSHNYLCFYRDAMEVTLELGEWGEAERYALALEDYTRPEPLPWSDFFIARARALAAHGRGRRDREPFEALERLRCEAERVGLRVALPAIARALAER